MYLTICPLRGPGHDGSVGKPMYFAVCPLHSPGLIPGSGRVFQGISPWLITRTQANSARLLTVALS